VYFAKQLIGAWLNPLPIAMTLLAIALFLRAMQRRRAAATLMAAGVGVALLASLGSVGNALLWPLETSHAALLDVGVAQEPPRFIVVLGSSYHPRKDIPVTSALDSVAMVRLIEGVRLFRLQPQATLVVSGGAVAGQPPVSVGYAKAAVALGVPDESILQMNDVLDTSAEIRTLRALVGDANVAIVTSAAHMPRVMRYCERYGVRAVAAPTGHLSQPLDLWSWRAWLLPSGSGLRKTETALHEYIGLLALRLGVN
jgi:uncharacterized SAM-binding protein YcdF (DUF218 family)